MSLANRNYISIFEDELVVSDQINSIASPPVPKGEPVQADDVPAFRFLDLVAPAEAREEARAGLATGKMTMGDLKDMLTWHFLDHFSEARQRYIDLGREASSIRDIIAHGSARARDEAADTMLAIRDLIGY
jgi:tryptophanyl-tRNA synthetase